MEHADQTRDLWVRFPSHSLKYNNMNKKVIDWNITGSLLINKWNLNIIYDDNTKETITDTMSNVIKIKNNL